MTARIFTPAQDVQLAAEYAAGKTFRELAEEHGGTERSTRSAVLRGGGKPRAQNRLERPDLIAPRRFPRVEDCLPVRRDYEAGASMATLARRYKCNLRTIKTALRRAGAERRPLGRPSNWTVEMAATAMQRFQDGDDLQVIADDLNLTRAALRAKLSRAGAPLTGRLRREAHPWWQGGTITVEGYVYVKPWDDDLPICRPNSGGYVAEHRLVMARSLGRRLTSSETVHHKNGDRTDNRLENLQLRQGKHGKGSHWVCRQCGSHDIASAEI